jgi:hypothetical protein
VKIRFNKTYAILLFTMIILLGLFIFNSVSIASMKEVTMERYEHPTNENIEYTINTKTNHLLLGRVGTGMEIIDMNSMSLITTIVDDFPMQILEQEFGDNIALVSQYQKIIILDQYDYHIKNELIFNSTDVINTASWVPNQNKIIYQRMGLIQIWDIDTDEITNTSISYSGKLIDYFRWDNDSENLLTLNTNGGMRLWNNNFSLLRTFSDVSKSVVFVEWINSTNLIIAYDDGEIKIKNIMAGMYDVNIYDFNVSDFMVRFTQDLSRMVVSLNDKYEVYDFVSKTKITSFEYKEGEYEDNKENEGVIWSLDENSIISFNDDLILVWRSNFHLSNLDEINKLESYGKYLIGTLIINLSSILYLSRKKWFTKDI